MKFTLTFLLIISSLFVLSQEKEKDKDIELLTDSTFIETDEDIELFEEVSDLDPQRSALLSAVIPGLGQIYNKQYWKVPIIFGGLTLFGHYINQNNELYHAFRNASLIVSAGGENPYESTAGTLDALTRNMDKLRRNRDYMIILGTVFYILNIVDAHVSAHLDEFNVNEDLALSIKPSLQSTPFTNQALGATLTFRF